MILFSLTLVLLFKVTLVLLCKAFKGQIEDVGQIPLLFARLGDNVTLRCSSANRSPYLSWYKHTAGQKPRLISSYYRYGSYAFYNELKDNPRFTVQFGAEFYHLSISNTQPSDSATYYCGVTDVNLLKFLSGIFLIFKGSSTTKTIVVQQPVSESVQPGASVTLSCTIHTEACAGGHRVYWFRHGSGESRPGIIYTHGDRRSDQCERSPEAGSPTQSCVYHLPKRNLSLSDAGTYYCAVASCGEILFGHGTKLDIVECSQDHLIVVYCLGVALSLCVILIIVLACIVYQMRKRNCPQCRAMASQPHAPPVSSSDNQEDEEADKLQYVALNFNRKAKVERQRSTMERDTVYSGVRYQHRD